MYGCFLQPTHFFRTCLVWICCCLVAKSCKTLWDPTDRSLPGSSVYGIFQPRIAEWVTILPFSSPGDLSDPGMEPVSPALAVESSLWATREALSLYYKRSLSHVRLFVTPWTVAYQGPLSMGFPRQEYCSGLPFPSPGDLPNPLIEPESPTLKADALPSEPPGKPITSTAAAAKSPQSCPTLCDPIDGSPPGSPIPGILQARTPEWVAISFSNARKWKVKVKSLSCVWLLVTPWSAAHQAPPSIGFSRQEYWSGVPLPSPLQAHKYIITKHIFPTNGRILTGWIPCLERESLIFGWWI